MKFNIIKTHFRLNFSYFWKMSSDSEGSKPDPDPGPEHCSVFLHAEKFTSTASSQIFLLQIGETIILTLAVTLIRS